MVLVGPDRQSVSARTNAHTLIQITRSACEFLGNKQGRRGIFGSEVPDAQVV